MSLFEGGSFKSPVKYFRGYVLRATRNKIIDVIRRRESERRRTPELIRLDSLDPSKREALINSATLGDIDASASERDEIVKRAVEKLKRPHRDVIQQVYFNKLSYEDTARTLNVKVGTVKSQLNRALLELKKIIAGDKKKDKS
jgi:RNA polymerase sigma-70 factor (ECF subfamily)